MNGMKFGLLWMKRGYGVSEEGREEGRKGGREEGRRRLMHVKLLNSVDIFQDNNRQE